MQLQTLLDQGKNGMMLQAKGSAETEKFKEGIFFPNLKLSLGHEIENHQESRKEIDTMLSLSMSPSVHALSQSSKKHDDQNSHIRNWDLQTNCTKQACRLGLST